MLSGEDKVPGPCLTPLLYSKERGTTAPWARSSFVFYSGQTHSCTCVDALIHVLVLWFVAVSLTNNHLHTHLRTHNPQFERDPLPPDASEFDVIAKYKIIQLTF